MEYRPVDLREIVKTSKAGVKVVSYEIQASPRTLLLGYGGGRKLASNIYFYKRLRQALVAITFDDASLSRSRGPMGLLPCPKKYALTIAGDAPYIVVPTFAANVCIDGEILAATNNQSGMRRIASRALYRDHGP